MRRTPPTKLSRLADDPAVAAADPKARAWRLNLLEFGDHAGSDTVPPTAAESEPTPPARAGRPSRRRVAGPGARARS
jgi:hypothetical protein